MNFNYIKPLPKNAIEIFKSTRKLTKEAGKMTIEFIKDNPRDAIQLSRFAILLYFTIKKEIYSKKLNYIKMRYENTLNESFKKQAKDIMTEISSVLKEQSLRKEEKEKLKSILNRHSAWVFG